VPTLFAYVDTKHSFYELFDPNIGLYVRSGVMDGDKDTGIDPFMRSYPDLIDVGIMGHCLHAHTGQCLRAGVQCYQGGNTISHPNMTLIDYQRIIDESQGKVMQIALGGRGDPNLHEDFAAILRYTKEHGIVPNYTTSGMALTDDQVALTKEYCGAVAVSWYGADYTIGALRRFIDAHVTTNIHYVLNKATLAQAIDRLQRPDGFPEGINAVVFLLHKPVGLGQQDQVLTPDMEQVQEFFDIINRGEFPYLIGFDACSIPGVLNYAQSLDTRFFDTCEGARFSMYISSDMIATPCSFDQQFRYGYSLTDGFIQEAWDSPQFEAFRDHMRDACPDCNRRGTCMGGCPLTPEIVLCNDRK
jgi:radical SAM protein with 4Fe4S-binding SPASM domain